MNENYLIGLMSGTSLDGLDIAYCKFSFDGSWSYDIIHSKTIAYSKEFQEKLKNAPTRNKSQLNLLSDNFGELMARELKKFVAEFSIDKLDGIASHGHTVFHEPKKRVTLQIGSPEAIFSKFKCPIIYDFRSKDIALGGQGAPLVPLADKYLFSCYQSCLNLGGFSNISFDINDVRIAFDICPVNIVLNLLSNKIGYGYDDKGFFSSQGIVHVDLLNSLNNLKYFSQSFPKSLGWEWVDKYVIPLLDDSSISVQNQIRTFVEHIVFQITRVVKANEIHSVLVTGGGAYNDFLLSRLNSISPGLFQKASNELIEYKEAMCFAFLGLLRMKNQVNVLSSVTGSHKDHSSGRLYPQDL
tara:strand:+ start:1628 stop:2692 length:1065 start_codon:yes stop_codon:yes gene_type:complete